MTKNKKNKKSISYISDIDYKHDIQDEYGYWWKNSILKSIYWKNVYINKENIDELIEHYKRDIAPHKAFVAKLSQEIVDELYSLKTKLNW